MQWIDYISSAYTLKCYTTSNPMHTLQGVDPGKEILLFGSLVTKIDNITIVFNRIKNQNVKSSSIY